MTRSPASGPSPTSTIVPAATRTQPSRSSADTPSKILALAKAVVSSVTPTSFHRSSTSPEQRGAAAFLVLLPAPARARFIASHLDRPRDVPRRRRGVPRRRRGVPRRRHGVPRRRQRPGGRAERLLPQSFGLLAELPGFVGP